MYSIPNAHINISLDTRPFFALIHRIGGLEKTFTPTGLDDLDESNLSPTEAGNKSISIATFYQKHALGEAAKRKIRLFPWVHKYTGVKNVQRFGQLKSRDPVL